GNKIYTYSGAGRYDVAQMIVNSKLDALQGGQRHNGVIVASGEEGKFADALSASGLAGMLDYPLVLTNGSAGALSSQARNAIAAIAGAGKLDVIIIGGEGTISPDAASELAGYDSDGSPVRLGGPDRYAVGVTIFNYGVQSGGWQSDTAFVARGDNFPDALAVASYAASHKSPIVLVDPNATQLETPASQILAQYGKVVVLGGTASVKPALYQEIEGLIGAANVRRLDGATRYEAGMSIVRWQLEQGISLNGVGFATGMRFPDALASGFLLAHTNSALILLSPEDGDNAAAYQLLGMHGSTINQIRIFGGENSVTPSSRTYITNALGWSEGSYGTVPGRQ
ncbi:MAG: cell wall-binding repeat-containing protein, partial [Coriobacteriales bacterium]|nr:cell wall-binding repeat-containing protein [Coriobacteriales bacterium]